MRVRSNLRLIVCVVAFTSGCAAIPSLRTEAQHQRMRVEQNRRERAAGLALKELHAEKAEIIPPSPALNATAAVTHQAIVEISAVILRMTALQILGLAAFLSCSWCLVGGCQYSVRKGFQLHDLLRSRFGDVEWILESERRWTRAVFRSINPEVGDVDELHRLVGSFYMRVCWSAELHALVLALSVRGISSGILNVLRPLATSLLLR